MAEITLDKLIELAEAANHHADEADREADQARLAVGRAEQQAETAQAYANQLSQALVAINEGKVELKLGRKAKTVTEEARPCPEPACDVRCFTMRWESHRWVCPQCGHEEED
jgi:hypothetical protein